MDTVEVSPDGIAVEDGDYTIPGVKGTGSEIKVAFVDPAGSMTGKLFPTGKRLETLTVRERSGTCFSVKVTLIDAANPFVLVDAATLPSYLITAKKDSTGYLEHMESIRRVGAVMMGLANSTEAAGKVRGTPKLALLSSAPADQTSRLQEDGTLAVQVLAFSMGKPHPSLQLTGAACLASAVCVDGTVANRIASSSTNGAKLIDALSRTATRAAPQDVSDSATDLDTDSESPSNSSPPSDSSTSTPPSEILATEPRNVRIFHSSGAIDVGVVAACAGDWAVVDRCSVSRTARRIFDGTVYYYE